MRRSSHGRRRRHRNHSVAAPGDARPANDRRLSAAHLAAIAFPAILRRLYVARDDDTAGAAALAKLVRRADAAGIEVVPLEPRLDDFNSDLRHLGLERLRASIGHQLVVGDRAQFLMPLIPDAAGLRAIKRRVAVAVGLARMVCASAAYLLAWEITLKPSSCCLLFQNHQIEGYGLIPGHIDKSRWVTA